MSDTVVYYIATVFSGIVLMLCHLHTMQVYKNLTELGETHITASKKLFELRDEILRTMSGSWKEHYNRFMNNTYLEFLDCAYHKRYGTKNGWAFRLPPSADDKESIDLSYYFTDEEVEDIKKARAIYGDDKRLEHMDKRLRL